MKQIINKLKSMVLFYDKKGSFTVETSIVFSTVFLMILVLVYSIIFMYQYIVLQSVLNEAANRGAFYYVKQFDSQLTWPCVSNLYWRIYDTSSPDKKGRIEAYIRSSLETSVIKNMNTVKTEISSSLLIKQLKIAVEEKYMFPVGSLLTVFGFSPEITLRAETSSPFEDNAEFLRSLDTVTDIKNCLVNSDNKWIGAGSQVGEVINKLVK